MDIWSDYLDIDLCFVCVGLCQSCGDPIMENETAARTVLGLLCENCIGLQEEKDK